jgi:hypothetical protein
MPMSEEDLGEAGMLEQDVESTLSPLRRSADSTSHSEELLRRMNRFRLYIGAHAGAPMEIDLEERIRQRAYELWEDNGRPEGGADEFWQRAERELRNETGLDTQTPLMPD